MSTQDRNNEIQRAAGFLNEILRQIVLIWRLMVDPRVPIWVKIIPPLTLLYIISPIDFLPDPVLGLGQLDDLAVALIGFKVFIELCPPGIVQRLRDELAGATPPDPDEEIVDASYQVLDD